MEPRRIGKRIKAFRKLKGYTQIAFAKKLDVSIAVLGNVERGTEVAADDLLNKIADTLSISREELTLENEENGIV
ncbi:helix-turn-helix domain-containing protein [Virgibacillus oceani]|uniref:Transcriptional regulator n=1 Tax=Virgibacillus oceani TaxID=1479511 RepID=A0A917M6Z0_9BACI|nr:helix-turn-helix transcriptional regulator [Virgibacillus oceani]GGG81905.1 transcriptional regulator [Virgibacillus oceani]